jgi:hypothetical protein
MPIDPITTRSVLLFVCSNKVTVEENFFGFIGRDPMSFEMINIVFIPDEEVPTFFCKSIIVAIL